MQSKNSPRTPCDTLDTPVEEPQMNRLPVKSFAKYALIRVCKDYEGEDGPAEIFLTIHIDKKTRSSERKAQVYQWLADHWADEDLDDFIQCFDSVCISTIKSGADVKQTIKDYNSRASSFYVVKIDAPEIFIDPHSLGQKSSATLAVIAEEEAEEKKIEEAPVNHYHFSIQHIQDYSEDDPEFVTRNKARYTCVDFGGSYAYMYSKGFIAIYKISDRELTPSAVYTQDEVNESLSQLKGMLVYPF